MIKAEEILDFLLQKEGSSFEKVQQEAHKADLEAQRVEREERQARQRIAREAREKAFSEAGTKELGRTLFLRVGDQVISSKKGLKCPACGGDIPEIEAHLVAAGEVLLNPHRDRGGAPRTKITNDAPCAKCKRKFEILSVLL